MHLFQIKFNWFSLSSRCVYTDDNLCPWLPGCHSVFFLSFGNLTPFFSLVCFCKSSLEKTKGFAGVIFNSPLFTFWCPSPESLMFKNVEIVIVFVIFFFHSMPGDDRCLGWFSTIGELQIVVFLCVCMPQYHFDWSLDKWSHLLSSQGIDFKYGLTGHIATLLGIDFSCI